MTAPTLAFAACVFDCDGTLVETGQLWRDTYRKVTGEEISRCLFRTLGLPGASTDQAATRLSDHYGRAFSAAEIEDALIEAANGQALAPMDGVEDLLIFLSERGVPTAVATNGPRAFVETVLGERLLRFFRFIQPSAELTPRRHKPAPEVYEAACQRLGVAPHDSVAFEDAEVGARSALAAGLQLVYVNEDEPPAGVTAFYVPRLSDERLKRFLEMGSDEREEPGGDTRGSL